MGHRRTRHRPRSLERLGPRADGAAARRVDPASPRPARKAASRWIARLSAALVVPSLLFGSVEGCLRWSGFGYPTAYFIAPDGPVHVASGSGETLAANRRFGWRFFPPEMARAPDVCRLSRAKPDGVCRIVVLGESAAMGTPNVAFGLPRMLAAVLAQRFPEARFEVVNAAMTAINSHAVRLIARDCAALEPDVVVVYMGNNEVVGPFGPGSVFGSSHLGLSTIRANLYVKQFRTAQALESLLSLGRSPSRWRGMEMFVGYEVAADDPRMAAVYDHFAANLDDIVDVGRRSGAEVVLCTVAVNLRDCPPFVSLHRADLTDEQRRRWRERFDSGKAAETAGDPLRAATAYAEAARLDDRHAELCYRRACCLLAAGRAEEARVEFVRARDLDALRFRADTRINEIIRKAAQRAERDCGALRTVHLLDAERLFAQHATSAAGLPGGELFYEHVHLRPEGNYLLAAALADHLARRPPAALREVNLSRANPPLERCCRWLALTDWDRCRMELDMLGLMRRPPFTARMDREALRARWRRARERAESELARTWLRQAAPIYEEALRRDPADVHFRAGYARVLQRLDRNEEAIRLWRQLLVEFPQTIPWQTELGGALVAAGKPEQAVDLYREMLAEPSMPPAVAHHNIAVAWIKAERFDEAEAELRLAVAIDPQDFKAEKSWRGVGPSEALRGG